MFERGPRRLVELNGGALEAGAGTGVRRWAYLRRNSSLHGLLSPASADVSTLTKRSERRSNSRQPPIKPPFASASRRNRWPPRELTNSAEFATGAACTTTA